MKKKLRKGKDTWETRNTSVRSVWKRTTSFIQDCPNMQLNIKKRFIIFQMLSTEISFWRTLRSMWLTMNRYKWESLKMFEAYNKLKSLFSISTCLSLLIFFYAMTCISHKYRKKMKRCCFLSDFTAYIQINTLN